MSTGILEAMEVMKQRTRILAEKNTEQLNEWAKQALACAGVAEFASVLNLR